MGLKGRRKRRSQRPSPPVAAPPTGSEPGDALFFKSGFPRSRSERAARERRRHWSRVVGDVVWPYLVGGGGGAAVGVVGGGGGGVGGGGGGEKGYGPWRGGGRAGGAGTGPCRKIPSAMQRVEEAPGERDGELEVGGVGR